MDYILCTMFDTNMLKLQRIRFFSGGINFLLTHFDMLQLLSCVVFELSEQTTINSQDQGTTETLSGWVRVPGMRPPVTVIIYRH